MTISITKPKIDYLSIILSIFAFAGLIAGVSFASRDGRLSINVLGPVIIGIIALIFYIRRQLKLKVPVLNMRVFRHRNLTLGAILVMVDFGIILSAMYLLPQYLQNGLLVPVRPDRYHYVAWWFGQGDYICFCWPFV